LTADSAELALIQETIFRPFNVI